MFGFVTANIVDLSDEEKGRYKAFYCGLCHALKERSGSLSRLCLSYDLTFLVMLLGSLYEPPEQAGTAPCPTNPFVRRDTITTDYTAYAADMAVALTYHKCLDDWNDDRKISARQMTRILEKPYCKTAERWPQQCGAIEEGLARISGIEGAARPKAKEGGRPRSEAAANEPNDSSAPDEAARLFGAILGATFVPDEKDVWAQPLWRLGAKLGRFIYFMDAAVDLDDDIKHDRYNPFKQLPMDAQGQRVLLLRLIGEATDEFERLPLERDLHAMRSVLYAGVWQQFCAKHGDGKGGGAAEANDGAAIEHDEGKR